MTDLAARPNTEEVSVVDHDLGTAEVTDIAPMGAAATLDEPTVDDAKSDDTQLDDANSADTQSYAWAPPEPEKKNRHLGWWIGIPATAALGSLVVASLMLIAPGTSIAGVAVGGMTQGRAAEAVSQRLAETTVVLTGPDGTAEVTGGQLGASVVANPTGVETTVSAADLGASVDAKALAAKAFADHPLWNVTGWNAKPVTATVSIDERTATAALRKAAPSLFVDPVNATMAFDATTAAYTVTPAVDGTGIDIESIRAALQDAFASGEQSVKIAATPTVLTASATTETVTATATKLNAMLDTAGFYVGEERTVPIDRAVAASWISLSADDAGAYTYTVDQAAIQAVVDTLPAAVDRAPVNGTEVTDTAGKVLRTVAAGADGRAVGDTTGIAAAYAAQLAEGNSVYALPVATTPATVTKLARSITVNLSEQHVYLFENGNVVAGYPISSGTAGHETKTGHFRISAKLTSQNMGNPDLTKAPNYYTKNVPNVMYFNGDQALHGAYWHHNFGHVMSHGCVNMPLDAAAFTYSWAPIGTEVTVTY